MISFIPTADLANPKIYYQIDNFYANHRNFVKSRNFKQLRGTVETASQISTCSPVLTMGDLGDAFAKIAIDGNTTLSSSTVANPCGLIAKYMFTDTYALTNLTGGSIAIDETQIAHAVDRDYKF